MDESLLSIIHQLKKYEQDHGKQGWLTVVIGILHWACWHTPGTMYKPVEKVVQTWERAQ